MTPSAKEGLLWTAANYDQKNKIAPASNEKNNKNKEKKKQAQNAIGVVRNYMTITTK